MNWSVPMFNVEFAQTSNHIIVNYKSYFQTPNLYVDSNLCFSI